MYSVVKVRFGSEYPTNLFFTDLQLKIGDWVLTTLKGEGNEISCYKLGHVYTIETRFENDTQYFTDMVILKLDMEEAQYKEKQLFSYLDIQRKLKERSEQLEHVALYEQMAKSDDIMKKLLEKFKKLQPSSHPLLKS